MARYIDADAFEAFGYEVNGGSEDFKDGFDEGAQFVLECIDNVPTADVVDVVRCKDCIYWDNYNDGNICRNVNGKAWAKPDDFCNEGRSTIE